MPVSTERIVSGKPEPVTQAQAVKYLEDHDGGKLTPIERSEIVGAVWGYADKLGIRPGPVFAQMLHETADFTFPNLVQIGQRNPAGIGATGPGFPGMAYPTWTIGVLAYYVHLIAWLGGDKVVPAIGNDYNASIDPRLGFVESARRVKGVATTWESLGGRWAVPGDGYGAAIDRKYDALLRTKEGANMVHLALSSGHHNTDGGSAVEYRQTGELVEAVANHAKRLGIRVSVMQPDGPDADADPGDGTLNMGLQAVARKVVTLDASDPVHYYLECHTEGGGGTGVFCIYPDAPGDVDTDVRDQLGPVISGRVSVATGLGLGAGGDGVMSEKQTGVGGQGFRLGVFAATEPIKDHCTRWITEYGAHDKQPDMGIQASPGFYDKCGKATAEAIARHAGLSIAVAPPAAPDTISQALTGWYMTNSIAAQGDLSNANYYECDVNFSGLYPTLQGWQRAIRGEFLMAWFHPDGAISCVHPADKLAIESNPAWFRRR